MKKAPKAILAACIAILAAPGIISAIPVQNSNQNPVDSNSQIQNYQITNNAVSVGSSSNNLENNINTSQTSSANISSQVQNQNVEASSKNDQKKDDGTQTFAQPFQNSDITLSGKSVRSTMYFTKIDYWNVKKATFNMTYSTTQLRNDQDSSITLALNGIKFYSFKPSNQNGMQTINVDIPTNLLQGSNVLTIEGQVINKDQDSKAVATPANWLTIYSGSNVNFSYTIQPPTDQIKSFYNHFIGTDTIANHKSVILVPNAPTNGELEAATYALAGVSRLITTDNAKIQLANLDDKKYDNYDYQIVIGLYKDLPKKYQEKINKSDVDNGNAFMKFENGRQKVLIVTAENKEALIKAGRYVANQELMQETAANTKSISSSTQTFTSELQSDGNYPLKGDSTKLTGPGHQEQVFFVNLPKDQTNSKGSYINLNFRYSDNLDFKTSLVTVYINNKPIGSKHLTAENANDDHFRVKIPNNTNLSNACTIRVAFDLNMKDNNSNNSQTPWAYIENNSNAFIKTTEESDLLFNNYPSCFIADRSFNDIAVQIPKKLNANYFKALTNIFNLIGNYAESNVGNITFYKEKMNNAQMSNHNLIILGTPESTPLIKDLNDKLFFKFNKSFTRFVSNEKLSIESNYGKEIGVVQLLFNPYNKNNAALIVSGANSKDVQLATEQIDTQAHVASLKGDAAVIDTDGQQYSYRFKKKVDNQQKISLIKRLKANPNFIVYVFLSILAIIVLGVGIFLLARKNFLHKNNGKERRNE